jgi:LemA protein
MKHERETLEAVITARNAAVSALDAAKADPANAAAIQELGGAEGALGSVLGRLFALSEAYPDLKANENMMQFQEELWVTTIQQRISRTILSPVCSASSLRVSSRSKPKKCAMHRKFPLPD